MYGAVISKEMMRLTALSVWPSTPARLRSQVKTKFKGEGLFCFAVLSFPDVMSVETEVYCFGFSSCLSQAKVCDYCRGQWMWFDREVNHSDVHIQF